MSVNPEQPKNIVICCDGTGNQFGETNSNVVKLLTCVTYIKSEQVTYYHPGVGTMEDPVYRHDLTRRWSIIKGLAFAAGFEANVLDAYRYLMHMYNPGDRVYLFGFSRGAYTVRALAGLLVGYGLLMPGNEGHIRYAWRMYVAQVRKKYKHHQQSIDTKFDFKETFSYGDFELFFVGLWDTVSSLGWLRNPVPLLEMPQNRLIRTLRHAISIDERRCFYTPKLWGPALQGQDIKQVWFAGVHCDVGGGYPQNESELSNIGLRWMLDEAEQFGLLLELDRRAVVLGEASRYTPDLEGLNSLYQKPNRLVINKSLKGLWWLLEVLPHNYYDLIDGAFRWRIPFGAWRQIPKGSLIHPTVVELFQDPEVHYAPKNLQLQALEMCDDGYFLYEPSHQRQVGETPIERFWRRFFLSVFFFIQGAICLLLGQTVFFCLSRLHILSR